MVMDTLLMPASVRTLSECFLTKLTLERLLFEMDGLLVLLSVTILSELFVTKPALVGFLIEMYRVLVSGNFIGVR